VAGVIERLPEVSGALAAGGWPIADVGSDEIGVHEDSRAEGRKKSCKDGQLVGQ